MSGQPIGAVVDEAGGAVRIEARSTRSVGGGPRSRRGERCVPFGPVGDRERELEAPFPMLLDHEARSSRRSGRPIAGRRRWGRAGLGRGVRDLRPLRRGVPRRCSHAWTQPPRVRRARDAAPLAGTLSLGTLASHTRHARSGDPDAARAPAAAPASSAAARPPASARRSRRRRCARRPRRRVGLGRIGLSALQGARIAGRAADRRGRRRAEARVGRALRATGPSTSTVDAVAAFASSRTATAWTSRSRPPASSVVSQAVAMLDYAGTAVAIGVPPIRPR